MSGKKRWVVTTSGNRSIGDIRKRLLENGFRVDQVLTEIGIITGDAADDVATKIRKVPGVADVSPEEPVDIGPPDAPVTW